MEVGSLYVNEKKKVEKVLEVETGKSWLAAKEEIGVIADWKI